MDAGTFYMRVFMGARPFESSEMDSLAEKMNVRPLMSKDTKERYFLTKSKRVAALSLGNKVLFGSRYYRSLTDAQRLAVAAHEFGHVLAKDSEDRRRRVVTPSILVAALASVSSVAFTRSALLLECILAISFLASVMLFSAAYAGQYHEQEMRSDRMAATFVDGESLVEAIQVAESFMATARKRRGIRGGRSGAGDSSTSSRSGGDGHSYRRGRHPAAQLRVEAIRAKNVAPRRNS
jgi:Zn-dependent protease with chaperone function